MKNNPCYEDMPVYGKVERGGLDTDKTTSPRGGENAARATHNQNVIINMKTRNVVVIVCVSLLALSLVAVIVLASYSYYELQRLQFEADTFQEQIVNDSSHEVASLMTLIRQLERELKQNKIDSQAQTSALERSQDSNLEQLRDNTTVKLSNLQSSVDALNTARDTTTTQLSSLQSSVNTLTNRVNSPVNLYQNCIQETRSCTFNANSFWGGCATSHLTINNTGYYTNDMRCEYRSNDNYFQSTNLHMDGSNVWCRCDVIWPTPSGHYGLPSSLTSTCSLIVTRCPSRFNLP